MTENDLLPRLAGTIFGAPLGPLGVVAGQLVAPALSSAFKPTTKVGTVLSYLNGKPYKVFAGPWGEQSFESYETLRARDPKSFPAVSGVLPSSVTKSRPQPSAAASTPPAPPVTDTDWTTPPAGGLGDQTEGFGTPQDIATENYPAQVQAPGKDPILDEILGLAKGSLSPEFLKARTDEAIRQFAATSAVTEALGAEKSEQRRRREVELAKIDQWTRAFQAKTAADALSNIAMGQAVIAFQQPNVNTLSALNQGATAAAQALGVSFPRNS